MLERGVQLGERIYTCGWTRSAGDGNEEGKEWQKQVAWASRGF